MAQIDCAVAPYLCNKVSVVSDVKPRGIQKNASKAADVYKMVQVVHVSGIGLLLSYAGHLFKSKTHVQP